MVMNDVHRQIARIDEYVACACGLPTEIHAVRVYLGRDDSGEAVADPAVMRALFVELRAHATSWGAISARASEELEGLVKLAGGVVEVSSGLLRGLAALDALEASAAALDEATLGRLNALRPYVDALTAVSLGSLGDTEAMSALIAEFRAAAAVLEAKLAGVVTRLKASDERIGDERTTASTVVALREARARAVAQFGEGSAAAVAIQGQVEAALAVLASREATAQGRLRLTYAAGRLFAHLQGLGRATLDAQSALTHLWLASSGACAKLQAAVRQVAGVATEDSLLAFHVSFEQILRLWTQVRDDAGTLYRAFRAVC